MTKVKKKKLKDNKNMTYIDLENPLGHLPGWIEDRIKEGLKEKNLRDIIREEIASRPADKLEVTVGDKVNTVDGFTHYQFPLVLKALSVGVNLALSGGAGTSKTTLAMQAAKALGLEYLLLPVNEGTTKADILGYCSATGDYVPSLLYRAMKEGKLLIIEEIDSGSAASLLALNNAVDNRELTFPNGETLKAHEGFKVICTMNTKGIGADRKYIGRNRLDAATLDRFCVIEVLPDLSLEAALIGVSERTGSIINLAEGGKRNAQEWLSLVREKRENYKRSHPDKVVSMRAVRDGWKLLNAGIGVRHVLNMVVEK